MRTVELPERLGHWGTAFEAVRESLTPEKMRTILAEMDEVEGISQLQSYMQLARNVMANDRTAAVVAAMLVTSGIRPADIRWTEADEVG